MLFVFDRWLDGSTHWRGKHFTIKEFAQRGNGWDTGHSPVTWDDRFIARLDALRDAVNAPLVISSGYRSPQYNKAVSSTGDNGPHTTGRAVDIQCRGAVAHRVLLRAPALGFTGIGVSQKGGSRFIHLDDLEAPQYPRPTVWSY